MEIDKAIKLRTTLNRIEKIKEMIEFIEYKDDYTKKFGIRTIDIQSADSGTCSMSYLNGCNPSFLTEPFLKMLREQLEILKKELSDM